MSSVVIKGADFSQVAVPEVEIPLQLANYDLRHGGFDVSTGAYNPATDTRFTNVSLIEVNSSEVLELSCSNTLRVTFLGKYDSSGVYTGLEEIQNPQIRVSATGKYRFVFGYQDNRVIDLTTAPDDVSIKKIVVG